MIDTGNYRREPSENPPDQHKHKGVKSMDQTDKLPISAILIMAIKERLINLGFSGLDTTQLSDKSILDKNVGMRALAKQLQIPITGIGRLRGLFREVSLDISVRIDVENEAAEIMLFYRWKYTDGSSHGYEVRHIFQSTEWNRGISS